MIDRRPRAQPASVVVDAFRRIDERIVPRADIERAAHVLAALPSVPWWTILETRILGQAPATDLFVGALRERATVERLLAARDAPSHQPAFFSAWADDAGPASDSNVMWFEWDWPMVWRAPLVWYSIDETFWPQPERVPLGLPASTRVRYLRSVAGASDEPVRNRTLARVIDALPSTARLFGSMWLGPRGHDADRIFVDLPSGAILPWLTAIGWPGDLRRAREWLGRITAPWENGLVQLEITDRLEPYLALETRQADSLPPPASERERAYFDWLVAEHGASALHLDALRAWRAVEPTPHGTERRSFHVKAVLRPDEPPIVKGYFGVYHSA